MAKLLFVVTEDWYFVSHRLPLAVAAKQAGYEVTVVTRPGRDRALIENQGIHFVPFAMDRSGMNPVKEALTLLRLARVLRRERPDLVHLVALKPVLLGNLAARIAGVPGRISAVAGLGFLFTDEERGGPMMPLVRRLLGWALAGSRVIVQNPDDARLLTQKLRVDPDSLHLVRGAGVDLQRFRPAPEPDGLPVVMLPSRLLWDKGVGEFVEAARRLRSKDLEARFVLVGAPDPDNPAMVPEEVLRQWQEEEVIEWWGHQADMASVLPQASLVCLPSYREGLPKVLIEALACGRAVVTCDVPGCREVVVHGENGLLVPPKDPAALAGAIERLLQNDQLRRDCGAAGRKRAERLFGVEQVVEETLSLYRKVASGKG